MSIIGYIISTTYDLSIYYYYQGLDYYQLPRINEYII